MAMGKFKVTGNAIYHINSGNIDPDADQMTAVLLDENHVWSDNHETWADILANEVDVGQFPDYTQVAVSGQVVTKITNGCSFDANDIDFGNDVTITAKWCYIVVGTPGSLSPTDVLFLGADLETASGTATKSSTNGDFDVGFDVAGYCDITRSDA